MKKHSIEEVLEYLLQQEDLSKAIQNLSSEAIEEAFKASEDRLLKKIQSSHFEYLEQIRIGDFPLKND